MQTVKKTTKKQIEAQINSAILMVKKGKNYRMHRFNDKGFTVHCNDEFAVLERVYTRTVYAIPSHGYYQLCNLVELANKPKEERTEGEEYLMRIVTDWIYLVSDADFMIQSELFVELSRNMWLAKNSILLSGEEITRMKFTNDFVKMFRLGAIRYGGEITEEVDKKIYNEITAIEDEAAAKINKVFIDNNVELSDNVIIKGDDITEQEAMEQLQAEHQLKKQLQNEQ